MWSELEFESETFRREEKELRSWLGCAGVESLCAGNQFKLSQTSIEDLTMISGNVASGLEFLNWRLGDFREE